MTRAMLPFLFALTACSGGETAPPENVTTPPAPPVPVAEVKYKSTFGALPDIMASDASTVTAEKVALGRALYFDTRLSKNHDISCNSCHQLDKYGVDNQPTSSGHKGQKGNRNSPSSYNAAGHFVQFWDGRAPDVEAQAMGPVQNPVEMGMTPEGATAVLESIPGYEPMFKAAFPADPKPVSFTNMGAAIGAFERTLVTPSPFDKYMKGDATALTAEQAKGLETFVTTGCIACHTGPYIGGTMYQKLGMVLPYETPDFGRSAVTNNEGDKFFFKVPSLRNVAKTGPYFHDGSVATLDEAIVKMGKHQLGKDLDATAVAEIKTFLEALTGELPPADKISAPTLPESGPNTPKADPS